jgi:hypothetical protein
VEELQTVDREVESIKYVAEEVFEAEAARGEEV